MSAYTFKTSPYAHQKTALKMLRGKKEFALLMEMGTGKTKVSIDEIGILYTEGEITGAVIVAPKGVYSNWTNVEIPIHMSDEIPHKVIMWDGFKSATKKKEFSFLCDRYQGLAILVINVEAFSSKKSTAFAYVADFMRKRKCAIYVDESTTIKNQSAIRTKMVTKVGDSAHYRRILTGSPVTRSPMDLFSQFNFLLPGILGFVNFYAFRARYAIMKKLYLRDRSVDVIDSYRNLDELKDKVAQHSFRVTKDECLDLPPKVYERRYVELTTEQARLYEELRKTCFAELEEGFVSVTEVIVMIMRLHQIVCGHVTNAEGHSVQIPSNRMSTMMDTIEEMDDKVIIWATYREDITNIERELKRVYGDESCVTYFGDTSTNDRELAKSRFQTDPECRFFVSNPQTGGYGITLTAATGVIYYSNSFDLEKRLQSEDRCHRAGQKKTVVYVDLVASETVDEKIIDSLRNKKSIADYVNGDNAAQFMA